MPIYKTGKSQNGKAQYRVFVSYKDAAGRYRKASKTVYGAAEARQEERRLQATVQGAGAACTLTVAQLYDRYRAAKAGEVRQTSLEKCDSILRNHILPQLASVPLSELSVACLQEWKTGIASLPLKTSTKNNAYRELNALLNFAVRMEWMPRNPLPQLGRFREAYFVHEQEALHYYTPEQFSRFIAVASAERTRSVSDSGYYVFFNLAFFTGLRKGEINALKWSDIEGDRLSVRRSISQKARGGDKETPPKNRSSYRTVQMPPRLCAVLEEHRRYQQQLAGFSEDFRVCGGAAPLRDTGIETHNARYAAAAGLPHIRIHDFRHSHASVLANRGINIQEIARRLGHSNVQQTWNTYAHLYPREEERAVAVLEEL